MVNCDECFWHHVKMGTIPDIDEGFLITVKKKCPCNNFSNFMAIGRCSYCKSILSGHDLHLHGGVCENCWEKESKDENSDAILESCEYDFEGKKMCPICKKETNHLLEHHIDYERDWVTPNTRRVF